MIGHHAPSARIAWSIAVAVAGLSCAFAAGCKSSEGKRLDAAIAPSGAKIPVGPYTLALTLSVSPAIEEGLAEWWIEGADVGNPAVGYLFDDPEPMVVRYSPPAAVPTPDTITVRVRVRSPGYADASASCTIQIVPPVNITIAPASASVRVGEALQFRAQLSGTSDQGVVWTVDPPTSSPAPPQGTIDARGLFIAPAMKLVVPATIRATSTSFPMVSATASVAVAIKLTVQPAEVSLPFGASQQLTATVEGTANTGVSWSALQGSITPQGLYVALADARGDDVVTVRADDDGNTAVGVPIHPVPPPVVISGLSDPAAPGDTLVVRGSGFTGEPELFMPMADGSMLVLVPIVVSNTELQVAVPPGCASGPLSIVMHHGQIPPTPSAAVPFQRLPRLRLHAPQHDLAPGESVSVHVAFLGAGPMPLSWSADIGTVDSGAYRAPPTLEADGFARVTACVAGTAVCEVAVLGLHPFRIDPAAPVVHPGGSIALQAVGSSGPTPASWEIVSGGGSIAGSGTYSASTVSVDAGLIGVAATVGSFRETAAIGVSGFFPGLVARVSDHADYRTLPAVGTESLALATDGGRAFVLAAPAGKLPVSYMWIDTYDVSNPSEPRWLGAAESFLTQPVQPLVAGGHLFQRGLDGAGRPCLASYDLTADAPKLVAQDASHTWDLVALDGLLLYAHDFAKGNVVPPSDREIRVYDTRSSGLTPIRRVSLTIPFTDEIHSMVVNGNRLYAAFGDRLMVFDIGRDDGTLVTTIQDGTWWANLRIASGFLFTGSSAHAGDTYPTRVYDIGSAVPLPVSSIPPMLVAGVRGTQLLGTTYQSGMRIVDFSDPAHPRVTAHFLTSVTPGIEPVWARDAVLGAEMAGGLAVYDVSAPGGPVEGAVLGQASPSYDPVHSLLVRGNVMYESTTSSPPGVRIYDLARDPPVEVARLPVFTGAMQEGGGFLYVSSYPDLRIFDVTRPTQATEVARLALPSSKLHLAGNVLYVASIDDTVNVKELVAVDVSAPGAPVRIGSLALQFYPRALANAGDSLLAAGGNDGLFVFDVSNPAAPVLAANLDLGAEVREVDADRDLAYVATSNGLAIVDVSDPAHPSVRAELCPPDWYPFSGYRPSCGVQRVVANADLVWTFGSYLAAWDLRDPSRPRLVSLASFNHGGDVAVESPYAYLAQPIGTVLRVDISRPRNVIHLLYPPDALRRP